MRQAGTIANEAEASRFADYLFTLGVAAKVERDNGAWAIWVRDEEHVARATNELNGFLANPADEKFTAAGKAAKTRRDEEARRDEQARRNIIDMRRRWAGGAAGPAPLTRALIVVSIAVAVLTRLGGYFSREHDAADPLINQLGFTEDVQVINERIAAGERWHPLDAIRRGEVWRLVTPIFLHFSPWHLLFNMYMLYDFGGLIESRRGTWRFALLVLVVAVLSNFGQYYFATQDGSYTPFGGMSGVIYGLFGYAWMKSRYDPTAEIYLHPNTVLLLMIWYVLCLLDIIGGIANWAHSIGLAVGIVIGVAPYLWRRTTTYLKAKRSHGGNQD